MRKLIVGAAAVALAAGSMVVAAPASAEPDPRYPLLDIGWCPGGSGDGGFIFGGGFCEGINYPDGSRWQITYSSFTRPKYYCIIHTGHPLPPLAPPNGCGR